MKGITEGRFRTVTTLIAATVMLLGVAPAAYADHPTSDVQPTIVAGNPTCGQFVNDPDVKELKVDPGASGNYSHPDGLQVTVNVYPTPPGESPSGNLFSWTSNASVLVVVAKGGNQGANVYDYQPDGSTGDEDLHSPPTGNGSTLGGLSHISFCFVPRPSTTLSLDSVTPDPTIVHEGDTVTFTVTETNDGTFTLTNVHVTVAPNGSCTPASVASLAPGASQAFNCSSTVPAPSGDYTITATGHGTHNGLDVTFCDGLADGTIDGGRFCDSDERVQIPVTVIHPGTTLGLNGAKTDNLTIHEGDSVIITLDETNTGDVALTNPHVTTDPAGICASLTAPGDDGVLAVGETQEFVCQTGAINATTTITFYGHGTDPTGLDVTYCEGLADGTIDNGRFCDSNEIEEVTITVINPGTVLSLGGVSPGTAVPVGSSVTITLIETNDGDDPLTNPHLTTDPAGVCDTLTAPGDDGVLAVGESQEFVCTINAVNADTTITFFGHGTDSLGFDVTYCQDINNPGPNVLCDQDEIEIVQITVFELGEGCTPGYWKNHLNRWAAAGYSPGQTLESVFDVPDSFGLDDVTLHAALSFDGGKGRVGAAKILLRAGVAALLNAAHPDVDYAYTQGQVITMVNDALASMNRGTMLSVANNLDEENNKGCPIN